MREKLLELMKREGLKPSQLAEMLGINPAGISHILAGRNKPGFDLLQKILRRFPRINPDWLLLDSDKMYRDDIPAPYAGSVLGGARAASTQPLPPEDLFTRSSPGQTNASASHDYAQAPTASRGDQPGSRDEIQSGAENNLAFTKPASAVARIVIFYTDQTFECFMPAKK